MLWNLTGSSPEAKPGPAPEAIFRSAPMTLVQLYVTIELARDVVFALGRTGHVHFRDLNSLLTPFQRTFVAELRDIDALDLKFEYLASAMTKYGALHGDPFATLTADHGPLPTLLQLQTIRDHVDEFHDRVQGLDESYAALEQKHLALVENRHVLNIVQAFHSNKVADPSGRVSDEFARFEIDDDEEALLSLDPLEAAAALDDYTMNSIVGTVARDKVLVLRRILWRTLRGNIYFSDMSIDEKLASKSQKGTLVDKNAFILFVHGDYLQARVRRIIQSMDGTIFDNAQGNSTARLHELQQLNLKIEDMYNVLQSTRDHLTTELLYFRERYADWHYIIKRERHIYEVLNRFDEDGTRRCLVGEGWIPKAEFPNIRRTLKNLVRSKINSSLPVPEDNQSISLSTDTLGNTASTRGSALEPENPFLSARTRVDSSDDEDDSEFTFVAVINELKTNRVPPTFHKTNKFTAGFQLIIDTYGIATYQEVNPGLATIITFPFLFAIMFGDLGHGFIVLCVALYFIKNERYFLSVRKKDEILEMAFNGRYIVLLMGVFSMYTGLMYNDIFSKSMSIFKSGWEYEWPKDYNPSDGPILLTAKRVAGRVYPFGMDWFWHGSENGLLFTNSYKMKMSIVIGYCHMNYSLFFSLVNHRFFKSRVDIIGNFIPGFLFMQCIFGYLVLTIIYKWCVDWFGESRQPPGLLNMLINMFLAPGSIEDQLYPGQKYVQVILVLIALACVPWLLLYKPMVLRRENNRAIELGYRDIQSQRNHDFQIFEEEEEVRDQLEGESREDDSGDEFDTLSTAFTFPNDIEPMILSSHGHGDDEFDLMDVVIHQVIHTIEFCLNCVSHTASYLRLWALSLAHAQLSSVLWTMTILNAFGTTGKMGIFVTVCLFAMWFTLTVCILVLMEGTSAMLHSLRLHWVEAMLKFFEGEGYAYEPFLFSEIEL